MIVLATTLSDTVFDRWQLLIDVAILVIFGFIHTVAWSKPSETEEAKAERNTYKEQAQTGIRAAAAGGLTVAGILIPLTILTVSLTASEKRELPALVLTDFFVANLWLVISLLLGLYVLYFAGLRGYKENILTFRSTGIIFGLQLLFLAVGAIRLVWGMTGLIDELI